MEWRTVLLRIVLAACVLGQAINSAQAEEHYIFDKSNTSIHFSVTEFGFSELTAEFTTYDGEFVFCLQHPERDKISATLYSAGIRTDDGEREEQLKGPDFFNAAQFPRVQFVSTSIKFIDKNDAEAEGNLTLLGVAKPITLHVHFLEKDLDSDSDDHVTSFSATGSLERSDFGMDHLIPIVGDEVRLSIEARGIEDDKRKPLANKP